ncbi:MAG: hypothetical protein MJE68_05220 [Proteobacteria bacterium]|nr:hypothetical protein [Pseudomonadota bacterium]
MYGLTQYHKVHALINACTCTGTCMYSQVKRRYIWQGVGWGGGRREKERNGETEAYDCQKNSFRHLRISAKYIIT